MQCPASRWSFLPLHFHWKRRTSRCRRPAPSCSASRGGKTRIRLGGGSDGIEDLVERSSPEVHPWTTLSRRSQKRGSRESRVRFWSPSGWSGAEWFPESKMLKQKEGFHYFPFASVIKHSYVTTNWYKSWVMKNRSCNTVIWIWDVFNCSDRWLTSIGRKTCVQRRKQIRCRQYL